MICHIINVGVEIGEISSIFNRCLAHLHDKIRRLRVDWISKGESHFGGGWDFGHGDEEALSSQISHALYRASFHVGGLRDQGGMALGQGRAKQWGMVRYNNQ